MNINNTLLNKLHPDNQVLRACTENEQLYYAKLWERKKDGLNFYQDPDELTEKGLWDGQWLEKKYRRKKNQAQIRMF